VQFLDKETQSRTSPMRDVPVFPAAVQAIVDSPLTVDCDSFVIAIVDGFSWDVQSCHTIKSLMDQLNQERISMIHFFVIGFDIDDEDVRDQCQKLCTATKLSKAVHSNEAFFLRGCIFGHSRGDFR